MLKDLLPLFDETDHVALRLLRRNGPSKDILTTYQDIASGEADKKLKKLLDGQPPTDVYFGVAPRNGDLQEYNLQCRIHKINALWLDVDKKGLNEDELLAELDAAGLPPASLINSSGRGWHAYWILKQPIIIDDYPEFTLEKNLSHGWVAEIEGKTYRSSEIIGLSDTAIEVRSILGGIAKSIEGGDTKTRDLSRILRVPGYRSTKPGAGLPKRTHFDPEATYSLEDFDDFLLMESNKVTRSRLDALSKSLLKISSDGENDGSSRLMKYVACCKRDGLGAQETVEVVRKIQVEKPFAREYSDADIEVRWEQSRAKPTKGKPNLVNFIQIDKGRVPRPTEEIYRDVVRRHRLYAIGNALHVFHEGEVITLAKPAGLMAWLNDHFTVDWAEQTGMLTKSEFLAYLVLKAPKYDAIEVAPHFPEEEEGVAYLAPQLVIGADEGEYLNEVLDGFRPATDSDRELIKALFMTVLWGGTPTVAGRRPAWMISTKGGRQTGVGAGKTTLAHVASKLSSLGRAGPIEIKGGNIDGEIALAVANDPTKRSRVMLIDNWKRERTRSDAIESLITSPTVAGRVMYVGPVSVRNSFTLIFTSNTAEEASTDMASRTVHIKLEPLRSGDRNAGWDKWVSSIDYERLAADVAWLMRTQEPAKVDGGNSRWQLWLAEIVGRCERAQDVVETILRRQQAMDGSKSDTRAVEATVAGFLDRHGVEAVNAKVYLPWTTLAAILGDEFGKLHNGILVKRLVRDIDSERLKANKDTSRRGYLWLGDEAGDIPVDYEIHQEWDEKGVFED